MMWIDEKTLCRSLISVDMRVVDAPIALGLLVLEPLGLVTPPAVLTNSAIRNLLAQQVELPALKAQAQANQEQWERLQHAYQQKLKTDTESSHQSTSSGISAWKKILILVIGIYACKKIYDWWNHKPENQSEESQEYGEEFSADLDQEFYTI